MNKRLFLIRTSIWCILLSCIPLTTACGNNASQPLQGDSSEAPHEISAYFLDSFGSDYGYNAILSSLRQEDPDFQLSVTAFSSQEEFMQQTMTELNAGIGPDLFLLDSQSPMSFEKMARNGTFLNLNPYLEADESYQAEDYYSAAMQAGQVNGEQFLLPIAFSQYNLISSQEKLKSAGISSMEGYAWEDILSCLSESLSKAELDSDMIPIGASLRGNEYVTLLLSAFGIPIVDMDKGQVVLEKETCKTIADFVKQWRPHINSDTLNYLTFLADTTVYPQVQYYISNQASSSRYYYAKLVDDLIHQKTVSVSFPDFQNPGFSAGQLYLYSAVNANSSQKELAYNTARKIMNFTPNPQTMAYGISHCYPARIQTLEDNLAQYLSGGVGDIVDGELISYRYDVETNQEILGWASNIQHIVVADPSINSIIYNSLSDYVYNDTKTFDECWDDLINRLTLYINE